MFGTQARERGPQPTAVACRDFAHVRNGDHIVIAPCIAADKACQHIDRANQ